MGLENLWHRGDMLPRPPLAHARVRILAGVLVPAVVAAGLALPVMSWPAAEREPVRPTVRTVAISGLDAQAIADSTAAMAAWDTMDGETAVEPLGLAPLPSTDHGHADVLEEADPHGTATAETVRARPLKAALATTPTTTDAFGLVAVTADDPLDPDARVLVRVREDGDWSEWTPLTVTEHAPDPSSAEAQGIRYGTEPLLVDEADGVQVRIDTPGGDAPADPQLVLVDNPVVDADADLPAPGEAAADTPISTANAGTVSTPAPAIITRAQWGADESLRRGSPTYASTIKAAFLHHTVTKTNYTPEQAAQQVRNLYAYFTKGLHYSDMGYNFIVDRFGRLYEGRAGGIDRAVIGGHTAGFNSETFAVSALGNFQKNALPADQLAAVNDSIASLMAWKLAMAHRNPAGTTQLVSDSNIGTSKVTKGQSTSTAVVAGHGDIGATACPGKNLSPQLPTIRAGISARIGVTTFDPSVSAPVGWGSGGALTLNTTTTAPLTWTVSIASRCGDVVRTLSGQQGEAGALAVAWDLRGNDGQPVPPGTYTFTLNGTNGADAIYPWSGSGVIAMTAGSPVDPCGPPDSFTLVGSGYGHGVGMSQYGALAMAKEGRDAASIVTHYYSGTAVTPVQDDMDIRVNLLYQVGGARIRSEALAGDGGAIEVTVGGNVVVGNPSDVFAFAPNGGNVQVTRIADGASSDLGAAPTVTVRWAGTRNPGSAAGGQTEVNVIGTNGSFTTAGHRYRYGSVEVSSISTSTGNKLNVVNSVRLHDEYLYGISEVSSSWPDAAMQAQALAARTYGLSKFNAGVRKACACHVDDGDGPFSDQTFTGSSKMTAAKGDRWVAAVNATIASETTGNAILHNGKPITAFYMSSSGGATTSAQDAWGGALPYVVSVDDPWSLTADNPNRSWTVKVSQAAMATAFGVPGVWKVDVTERHAGGAVRTLTATLQDGSTKSIGGASMRSTLGLKSQYVTSVDGSGGATATAPSGGTVTAPAPQAEAVAVTLTMKIGPTTTPKAGSALKFKGKVLPKAKGVKVLRQMNVNGEWKTMAKTRTNAKGKFTFKIKKAVPAGATYVYRVVAMKGGEIVGSSSEQTVVITPKKAKKAKSKR